MDHKLTTYVYDLLGSSSYIMAVLVVLSVVAAFLLAIYFASTYKFDYWKKKNVPFAKPVPVFGNYGKFITLRKIMGIVVQDLCKKFPNVPYFGAFYGTEPVLVIQDPELIKLVITKDFYYFNGREVSDYTHNEILTSNVFFSGGDRWKVTRQNLTPLFSSAKMKNMFYLIEKCAHTLETALDKHMEQSNVLEVKSMMARYTISGICSCVFGIDTHTLDKPENNPFTAVSQIIFENTTYRGLKNTARSIWPAIFYGLGFKMFPSEQDRFFGTLLRGIFNERGHKPSTKKDFVDLVLNFNEKKYITGDSISNIKSGEPKKVDIVVDEEFLIAQCITFFAAGFETTATTLSFTLFELAKRPDIQKKAFEEIDLYLAQNDNQIKYNCINDLPYLHACLNETMRLYPVLNVLTREVADDYTFPSGLKVEKGLRVHLPVYAIHLAPEHFPDPEEYRPERFLPENKDNIKPYTYLPFGEGPRLCLGMRFAIMKMLPGLVTVLKKYRVELAPGMATSLEFEPRFLVTQAVGGININMTLRQGWEQRMYVKSN